MLPNDMDSFALVGFNRVIVADRCRRLSHYLLVDSFDLQLGSIVRDRDRHAIWDVVIDIVRESELQQKSFPFQSGIVSNTADLDLFLKTVNNPLNHSINDRPRSPIHGVGETGLVHWGNLDLPIVDLKRNVVDKLLGQLSLWALELDGRAID